MLANRWELGSLVRHAFRLLLADPDFLSSGYFTAFFRLFNVEDAADPLKLAACCPEGMDPVAAMKEAQGAIQEYKRELYRRATCDWGGPKEDSDEDSS